MELKNWELGNQLLREGILGNKSCQDRNELLQFAAFIGDTEVANFLVNRGADTNFKNEDGMTALHFAVSPNNKETIQLLPNKSKIDGLDFKYYDCRTDNHLTQGSYYYRYHEPQKNLLHGLAECNYIGYTNFLLKKLRQAKTLNKMVSNNNNIGVTFQHESRKSNMKMIEMLLNFGSDINSSLKNGKTPLHLAVDCGHVGNVEILLKYNPNVNSSCTIDNEEGHTALHFAAKGTKEEIVEMIINTGANINASTKSGMTPLHLAVENGILNNVKMLLKYKPDINCVCTLENEKGYSPLHFAAKGTNKEIVKFLLNSGAEINKNTENGLTPLHLATKYGRVDIVKILLIYNPEVNYLHTSVNEEGYTPLHFAAKGSNEKIVEILLNSGSFINARNVNGKTPLILAVENDQVKIVKVLLKYNPKVNYICTLGNEEGYTPLHFATKGTNEEIVDILLNSGADINAVARNGKTPLHLSVESGCVNIVKRLLIYKPENVSCNSGVDEGYTPLHTAAKESKEEIIELLLKYGVHINAITKKGKTPLHLAVEYSRLNNVKILLAYEADINCSSASGDEEEYTRFVFDSEDGSKEIIEKLLNNQKDFYNLHFLSRELTCVHCFKVIVKYKPVVNCMCSTENTKNTTPIHFAIRGCTDNLLIALMPVSKRFSTMVQLGINFTSSGFKNYNGKSSSISKYISHDSCSCSSIYSEGYTPLHFAAKGSNEEITELLLNNGANINALTINGESALYLAVEASHVGNVNVLLKHKPNINLSCTLGNNTGYTPLHIAAARFDNKILEVLLYNGADVNASTSNGETPLFPAVKLDHVKNIQILLKHNLDVNNENNQLAFLYAITHGKKNIFNILKQYGFTINSKDVNNVDVLYNSIVKKYLHIFDDFVRLGFDVNTKTNTGDPIFHVACKENNEIIVRYLIEHNVDINSLDIRGNTALHILTTKQNVNLMNALLEHSADVNIKNSVDGTTALIIACKNYDHSNFQSEQCIKVLLRYNANFNLTSNCGYNALCCITAKEKSYDILKLFLELGADVNIKSDKKCSALQIACQKVDNEDNQPEKYVDLLLKYGADVNSKNSHGTALHDACYNFLYPNIITHEIDKRIVTLLEHGADVNVENYCHKTPLQNYLIHYQYYQRNSKNIPEIFINTTLFLIEQLVMRNLSQTVSFLIDEIFTQNRAYSEKVQPLCIELRSHFSKCEEEITNLRNENIREMSLYDILTGNIQMLATFTANNDINIFIVSSIKERFPIYSNTLINNLKKGKERCDILKLITFYLNSLHLNKLPDLVIQKIIDNLNERDIKIFGMCMTE